MGLCVIKGGAERWDYASLRGAERWDFASLRGAERWDYASLRGSRKVGLCLIKAEPQKGYIMPDGGGKA